MFRILCEVSGGVTGYRSATLKHNGVEMTFDTREDAQAECDRLMDRTNGNPHRTADFRYTVME